MSYTLQIGEKSPYKIPDMDQHRLIIDGQSGLILLSHLADPRPVEIDAYDSDCERLYSFYKPRNVIFFIWKFGNMHVMDTPFHASASDLSIRFFPFPKGSGFMTTSILVDRNSGIIKGIHSEGIGNALSSRLAHALNRQMDHPIEPSQFQNEIAEIYERFDIPQYMLSVAEEPWYS